MGLVSMWVTLRKQDVPIQDQAEEIISHLMGKARDVVKIALRSNPALDLRQKPELVYDILLQYLLLLFLFQ